MSFGTVDLHIAVKLLQVSQVAQQLNLNPQTLYFYERIGLIPEPARSASGYRLFSEADVERLSLICRAKTLGLTLDEIKDILLLQDGQSLTCQEIRERLQAKVAQIEAKIAQLQALKAELIPLIHRCDTTLQQDRPDADCQIFRVDH